MKKKKRNPRARAHTYTRGKNIHVHTAIDTRDTWRRQFHARRTRVALLGIVHYGASFISVPLNLQDFMRTSNVYLFKDVVPVSALLYSRND